MNESRDTPSIINEFKAQEAGKDFSKEIAKQRAEELSVVLVKALNKELPEELLNPGFNARIMAMKRDFDSILFAGEDSPGYQKNINDLFMEFYKFMREFNFVYKVDRKINIEKRKATDKDEPIISVEFIKLN